MPKLFGFKIQDSEDDRSKKSIVSPVPENQEDSSDFYVSSGFYGQYVDIEGVYKSEYDLIKRYREMALHPEVDGAIEDVINEAIVSDQNDSPVQIDLSNVPASDKLKKIIRDEFIYIKEILDFDKRCHEILRNWYVDGRIYYHKVIDLEKPQEGIKEVRYIDPTKIKLVRKIKRDGKHVLNPSFMVTDGKSGNVSMSTPEVEEFYEYDPNTRGGQRTSTFKSGVGGAARISKDSITYVHSGLVDRNKQVVLSYLHKAIKALNQLRMIEDSLVIYRLSRAPERRIFYIDVGNLPKIKAAVAITSTIPGSVVKVSAGTYVEDNPIKLGPQISVIGDSLREVSVVPNNANQDLFHVAPGNYVAEMSYTGSLNAGKAIFAFDPDTIRYFSQSPYIQNCTNFIPNSIGLKIDGSKAIGPLKSMVLDSYTQYNQSGVGASITNEGYAQLVSLFTICDDVAVFCGSGGACDLTNSNSSFGNYGLIADGVGPHKYTGIVSTSADAGSDTFVLSFDSSSIGVQTASYDNVTGILTVTTSSNHNFTVGMGVTISGLEFTCPSGPGIVTYPSGNNGYIFEISSVGAANSFTTNVGPSTLSHSYQSGGTVALNIIRPFDGQVVYFEDLYYTVKEINITNPGSGYNTPPTVTIADPSTVNDWGVGATAVAEMVGGSVDNVEMVSNGRGYTSIPTVTFSSPDVGINTATGAVKLLPTYYSITRSTPISAGICTITLNENVPYAVGVGTTVPFFKQSRVLASGHSFEYIGSGTNINASLPAQGGVPIQENETDSRNGGLVVYTSTDQAGNFRIGDGVQINQVTGTISGTFYSKSLFATMTPFILALGGD